MGEQLRAVAHGRIKNWVSFGTNSMTTNNAMSYIYLRANQEGKRLNSDFKHYIISPELTDTGVLCGTDWVQIRNQTDPALIGAMIYHMIVNTFNPDGSLMANPMLDIDYIDTVLYGFFDSPAYWVNTTGTGDVRGAIRLTDPSDTTNWRMINEVPAGRSYSSWIMGSDDRLTKAFYDDSRNTKGHSYTSKQFANGTQTVPRAAKCSLMVKGTPASSANTASTAYYMKKDYMVPKTPAWAETITGIPAQMIQELAELYAKEENKPILTEWTGGLQKAEGGVVTLFAIQTLFAVTKNWGYSYGSTGSMYQTWATTITTLGMGVAEASPVTMPTMPAVYTTNLSTADAGSSTALGSNTVPPMSITEHHQGLYFAFKDVLDANPKFTGAANPEWDGETRYLFDAAGAKAQVLYKRDSTGVNYVNKSLNLSGGGTGNYYEWIEDANGEPVCSGKRFYLGAAGTNMNGIANTNWAAEIFRCLPLSYVNPDDPDTFCMAVFDFHLSTQAMFADYVFPMANSLEGYDSTSFGTTSYSGGSNAPVRSFIRPAIITPPGEAMDTWDSTYVGWKQRIKTMGTSSDYARIDGGTDLKFSSPADASLKVIGEASGSMAYISHTEKYRRILQNEINKAAPGSILYGITVDEFIAKQIRYVKQDAYPTDPGVATKETLRTNLDSYLAGGWATADLETAPFITYQTGRRFDPAINNALRGFTAEAQAIIPATGLTGTQQGTITSTVGRMTCFAEYAVLAWNYGHDIYHGWLPENMRGGRKVDYEGDPFLYPIPMYYDFRDSFNEAYGVFNPRGTEFTQKNWKLIGSKPATNDVSLIKDRLTLTVGSTHDRYRSHSSTAENPLTRELNCRTKGGGWASGNDWQDYGVIPDTDKTVVDQNVGMTPMRSKAIQQKNMQTASWHEFWLNDEDAAQYGIKDGDLIRVSNPVGAIRCTARVTARIVRGHGQIHHGAWYDPNPADGVDDGACANTLMSNRPTKFDYGNSVHCAYCVVEKETNF